MKYIIIGLGNYGSVLAEELSALGHEVIGVDTNERRVDVLKDIFTRKRLKKLFVTTGCLKKFPRKRNFGI